MKPLEPPTLSVFIYSTNSCKWIYTIFKGEKQVHKYSEKVNYFPHIFTRIPLTRFISCAGGDITEWPWANNGIGPDGKVVLNKLFQSINH